MQHDKGLKYLDKLIADLGGAASGTQSESRRGLLLEHLQAARRDLLGSMPGEYGLSLQQAAASLDCIHDKNDRNETKRALRRLIDSEGRDGMPSVA
jgi:hypothetical protein